MLLRSSMATHEVPNRLYKYVRSSRFIMSLPALPFLSSSYLFFQSSLSILPLFLISHLSPISPTLSSHHPFSRPRSFWVVYPVLVSILLFSCFGPIPLVQRMLYMVYGSIFSLLHQTTPHLPLMTSPSPLPLIPSPKMPASTPLFPHPLLPPFLLSLLRCGEGWDCINYALDAVDLHHWRHKMMGIKGMNGMDSKQIIILRLRQVEHVISVYVILLECCYIINVYVSNKSNLVDMLVVSRYVVCLYMVEENTLLLQWYYWLIDLTIWTW